MTLAEFQKIALPPIDSFIPPKPPLATKDVMLAAYRLINEHEISCPKEVVILLDEVEHERVLDFCDKLEAIK